MMRRWCLLLAGLLPTVGCTDVRLTRPSALWLLWLVPAVLGFQVLAYRLRRRRLARLGEPALIARLSPPRSRARRGLKALLELVAVTALLLTLAGFQYGYSWEEVTRRGVDIVVALDTSDSMLVRDAGVGGELTRMERARRELRDFLDTLEGDRVALVAFSGDAFLEVPLTFDYSAAGLFLDTMDTDAVPVEGTDLAQAIRTSLEALENSQSDSKAILLITDGEDHSGEAEAAAAEAAAQGARIFAIGIGREEPTPIPEPNGGFRRRRGEIVLSKLDEPTLQKIAVATNGRYVRSVTGDLDLDQIYRDGIKATLEDRELGESRRRRWKDRFQWLLALAAACWMLEPLISEVPFRQEARNA